MALNAKKVAGNNNGPKQENIEPGTYPARLVQIIDLGLQAQRAFQGKDKAPANEIMLTYELVDLFMKDDDGNDLEDKPRWISETLPLHNLRADRAKSTQRYYAFDPKEDHEGDWTALIGYPINVTIVNNASGDRIYDNVATVSAMRPRDVDKCPELVNDSKVFSVDEPDMKVFESLPAWIQDKIKGNLNFEGSELQKKLKGGKAAPAAKEKVKAKPAPKVEEEEADDEDAPY